MGKWSQENSNFPTVHPMRDNLEIHFFMEMVFSSYRMVLCLRQNIDKEKWKIKGRSFIVTEIDMWGRYCDVEKMAMVNSLFQMETNMWVILKMGS